MRFGIALNVRKQPFRRKYGKPAKPFPLALGLRNVQKHPEAVWLIGKSWDSNDGQLPGAEILVENGANIAKREQFSNGAFNVKTIHHNKASVAEGIYEDALFTGLC